MMAQARIAKLVGLCGALLIASAVTAQMSCLPKMVERKLAEEAKEAEKLFRFTEAFERYQTLSYTLHERAMADSVLRADMADSTLWVFESGIECAERSGNLLGAADLIDTLIVLGRASEDQWLQRIQLAYQLGNLEEAHGIWEQGKIVLRSPEWNERAESLNRLLAELEENETPAILSRFRPSSDVPEFGAVPFGGGVVFVSTNEVPGILPLLDGWTGMRYSELRYTADRDSADNPVRFGEKIKRTDLMKSGRSMFHDGPVGFSSEEDVAFVTRNHNEESSINGARTRHLRIDMMERKGDVWVPSEDTLAINDPSFSTCHGALDTLGNLVFSSNRPGGHGGMDLWRCQRGEDGTFGPPENLGPRVNTSGNEVFPFVNSVNQMYFSSNGREFSFGGLDVYKLVEGESEPVLLGQPVNSFADDFAIHVDETGVGYLSSNRGGQDRVYNLQLREVFADFEIQITGCDDEVASGLQIKAFNTTTKESSTLTTDVNGKILFQTIIGEVMELTFEGNWTYQGFGTKEFVSRVEGFNEDIIRLDYTPRDNQVQLLMEEVNPNEIDVELWHDDGSSVQLGINEEGLAFWGLQEYATYSELRADAIGYQTQIEPVRNQEDCPRPDSLVVPMRRVVSIDLSSVYYDLDKATLRPRSKKVLDSLVVYMKAVPAVKLELSSHTDCRGSDDYNQKLSQRRAQSCVDYIIATGISKDRIVPQGYGEQRLRNECADGVRCTEAQHQDNRRTELRIIAPGESPGSGGH